MTHGDEFKRGQLMILQAPWVKPYSTDDTAQLLWAGTELRRGYNPYRLADMWDSYGLVITQDPEYRYWDYTGGFGS